VQVSCRWLGAAYRELILRETAITDGGLKRLEAALPDCRIYLHEEAAETSLPKLR
jgi:hypothetical protein